MLFKKSNVTVCHVADIYMCNFISFVLCKHLHWERFGESWESVSAADWKTLVLWECLKPSVSGFGGISHNPPCLPQSPGGMVDCSRSPSLQREWYAAVWPLSPWQWQQRTNTITSPQFQTVSWQVAPSVTSDLQTGSKVEPDSRQKSETSSCWLWFVTLREMS